MNAFAQYEQLPEDFHNLDQLNGIEPLPDPYAFPEVTPGSFPVPGQPDGMDNPLLDQSEPFPGAGDSSMIGREMSIPEQFETRLKKIFAERLKERLEAVERGEMEPRQWSVRELVPEFFQGDYPKPGPPIPPFVDEGWKLDYGDKIKTQDRAHPELDLQKKIGPYDSSKAFSHVRIRGRSSGRPLPRRNPSKKKTSEEEQRKERERLGLCPHCGVMPEGGICRNTDCPYFGEVVDEEIYRMKQEEIEEAKVDVMKRWQDEMGRLEGS